LAYKGNHGAYDALERVADAEGLSRGALIAAALIGFAAEWTGVSQIAIRQCARGSTFSGGRPSGVRPSGDRSSGGRSSGGRPSGDRPSGGRPSGGLAEGVASTISVDPELSILDICRLLAGDTVAIWIGILAGASVQVDFRAFGADDLLLECKDHDKHRACEAAQFMDAFWERLNLALENAAAPRREVLLVTPAQASSILALGRGPAHPWAENAQVHELIYEVARGAPDAVAIESAGSSMTYAHLCATADRICGALHDAGVPPDGLVGLAVRRNQLLIPTIIAIWRAHCAYAPLEPTMPAVRRDRIMQDLGKGGMEWVIADQRAVEAFQGDFETHDQLPAFPGLFLCRLRRPAVETNRAATPPLAYVLYTSGSTGQPKGTMVTHRNVVAFLHATEQMLGGVPQETVLATTPLTFDISVLEIFWPLVTGRRVLLLNSIVDLGAGELTDALSSPRPKLLQVTPSTASLVRLPAASDDLRIVVGGEALPVTTATKLLQRCTRLYNAYGPTEATVWVTYHEVAQAEEVSEATTVSLGRPLPNCGLIVLDRHGRIAPVGMEGELHIYGPQVAAGYLNAPGSAPFYQAEILDGARAYRTGDRVRWSSQGTLEFVGRVDGQIKVSGNRVELGEVEAALAEHPGVDQAAVIVRARDQVNTLHAFVTVAQPTPTGEDDDLERAFVKDWTLVFDDEFAETSAEVEAGQGLGFWRSEVDGSTLDAREMFDWYQALAGVLKRLGATRVLDVGCGTGALLPHLASFVRRYVGQEPSRHAVTRLRSLSDRWPGASFLQGTADALAEPGVAGAIRARFDGDGGPDRPDGIVLNSVVQYFPSLSYLTRVLDAAADLLADEGSIVIADVRSLPLLSRYADWLERAGGDRQAVSAVKELCIDPRFFADWASRQPRRPKIWVTPRIVERDNELSLFRYDLIISIGAGLAGRSYETVDYGSLGGTPDALIAHLEAAVDGRPVAVTGIPNRLLVSDDAIEAVGMTPIETQRLVDRLPGAAVGFDPMAMADGGLMVARTADGDCHDWTLLASTSPRPAMLALEPWRRTSPTALGNALWPFIHERLPGHMIPATINVVEAFPLTGSGKVDRRQLSSLPVTAVRAVPHPRSAQPPDPHAAVPQDAETQRVLHMMSELLGASLGPVDDFVHAGGTSLDAAKLSRLLWEMMRWDLRPGTVLRLRNARAICAAGRASVQPPEAVKAGPHTPRLSMAQHAMVSMSYLNPVRAGRLNVSLRWRLSGNISDARIGAAMGYLVERHPILRSTVSQVGKLSILAPAAASAMAKCDWDDDLDRPFDLSREVPIRWAFHRSASDDAVLRAVFHHISVDDAAIDAIHGELLSAYAESQLDAEPLDARYSHVVDSERMLYLRRAPAARQYWAAQRGVFASCGRVVSPQPPTRPSTTDGVRLSVQLPAGARRISEAARRADVTPYAFFLAVVGWSVGTTIPAEAVLAGVPISGRETSNAEGLLGCYANLVPVMVPVHRAQPDRTVSQTAQGMLSALDHGVLSFAEIWRLADLPHNDQGQPAIAVVCQLNEMPTPETIDATTFTLVLDAPRLPMYPLMVRGETRGESLTVHADFEPTAVGLGQAKTILARIGDILREDRWKDGA
jgi:amino acid adenylation domain-containing protein